MPIGIRHYAVRVDFLEISDKIISVMKKEFDYLVKGNNITLLKYKGAGGKVIIPNSVTSIEDFAFQFCFGLTSVTIGNSVTSIGNFAFYGCTGLTSVTIPDSVTSLGNYAFAYCSGLTRVNIPINLIKKFSQYLIEK
jgi:hypothetical protein